MRVLVDGRETQRIDVDTDSLNAIYRETIKALAAEGRTVVKVTADGRELSGEDQERMLSGDDLPEESLAFESQDTRGLAVNTLREVRDHFTALRDALKAASEALGRDERTRAFEALRPALEVWLATSQAIHQVVILTGIDIGAEGVGSAFLDVHRRTVDIFGHVQSTLQEEDWVRLNDLLEYELIPLVDEWADLVQALQTSLQPESRE